MINKLLSRSLRGQLAITAGAVVLALVVGAVIMVVTSPIITGGFEPWLWVDAYLALVQGATGVAITLNPFSIEFLGLNGVIDTLVRATPYILAGLAVGIGFKAGLFNIGAQGQFLMGALGAVTVAVLLAESPVFVAVPLALIGGVVAGAAYGFIPGWLKANTGAHEVVVTIMLNYVALAIVSWAVTGPLRSGTATFARTDDVGNAALPIIGGPSGHELHAGVLVAFAAVPIVWWILYRTTIGFEVRTVGANPDAARYAGMRPRLMITGTMAAAGLLAGLAGAIEILGVQNNLPATYATTVGFDAITVALLGRANPWGILFGGILLGALRAGAPLMQIAAGVPIQMVDILQGVILFFLAADLIVRWVFRLRDAHGGEVDELKTVTSSYGGSTASQG
ncbi:MAG: ABC transporter permease [Candidatus Limnocylindrales bacterium]